MQKMKFAKALALCLPLTLMTACFPSGELLTEDDENVREQIDSIVSENDHLDIDIQTEENTFSELPKINVRVMEWNDDKLKDLFLEGRSDITYEEWQCDWFSDEMMHIYEEGEKYWLAYEPGRLTAEYRQSDTFGYGTLESCFSLWNYSDFFTDDSISILPKDEAIKSCTDILEKAGLTNYSEPTVYAVTKDKVNQLWHEKMYDEYENYADWTSEEEEVYVMRFPIEYNGVPVTTYDVSGTGHGQGGYFVGSYSDFVVTKDKVFSLTTCDLFSPEYETGETVSIKCSGENALKIGAEYYAGIDLNGQSVTITDCRLVYVPYEQHDEKNFTLLPMWEISASLYMQGDIMSTNDCLFVDAQSGSVIIW